MKYYIFSHGDSDVGIAGCSAHVEIEEIENWKVEGVDCLDMARGILERSFSEIFGEKAYVSTDNQDEQLPSQSGTDWENEYKKQTGKDAYLMEPDAANPSRYDTVYDTDYIAWLENKLDGEICARKDTRSVKIVWNGFHHDLDVISPVCSVGGVMVVHVSNESIKGLMEDNEN